MCVCVQNVCFVECFQNLLIGVYKSVCCTCVGMFMFICKFAECVCACAHKSVHVFL